MRVSTSSNSTMAIAFEGAMPMEKVERKATMWLTNTQRMDRQSQMSISTTRLWIVGSLFRMIRALTLLEDLKVSHQCPLPNNKAT